ncbi:SDR family oxidoreductase [Mycobacterium sp. C31M]
MSAPHSPNGFFAAVLATNSSKKSPLSEGGIAFATEAEFAQSAAKHVAELDRRCIDVQVIGPRPVMMASVVNVLSIAAKAAPPGSLPTAASRAAGLAITKALSKELGQNDIRIDAVLLGTIESGQWERLSERTGRSIDEIYTQMSSGVPLVSGRKGVGVRRSRHLLAPRVRRISPGARSTWMAGPALWCETSGHRPRSAIATGL